MKIFKWIQWYAYLLNKKLFGRKINYGHQNTSAIEQLIDWNNPEDIKNITKHYNK